MAFELSDTAAFLASQTTKEVILILEIDGLPTIYGTKDVQKFARIGSEGLLIGNFVIGEAYTPPNSQGLISIKDGTTKNVTSQIQIDKSVASSVSTMKIALVDKDNFVSNEMASGNIIEDILSREAVVSLGFQGGAHPEDSVRIFSGNITDFNTKTGLVNIIVSHPDNLKRQSILPRYTSELTSAIDASQTTIPVTSTANFTLSETDLTSYIQIEDEIIEVGGISGSNFINCVRGRLGTFISPHDNEEEVESFYRLQGAPIDLALNLMLSGDEINPRTEVVNEIINNRIIFNDFNIQENQGLVEGDLITIPSKITNAHITGFEIGNGFSAVLIDTDLGVDLNQTSATFTSKFKKYSFGGGFSTRQIDVEQFEKINALFGGSFPPIDIYLRDTVNLKELLDIDILFPIGAISVPRKGRISITYTSPPLAEIGTKTITSNDVVNPNAIEIKRNTNNKFYNTIEYKFDDFSIEEKLQRTNRLISGNSLNRIPVGEKQLSIEAKGFRRNASNFIDIQSRRFIDRYRFGAESFKMEVTYGQGFNSEVGDIVIFDGTGLNMFDSKTNSREEYSPRLLEVTNKSLDVTGGRVTLELTDTALALDGRYGVVGPSSRVVTATTTTLDIQPIVDGITENQATKWNEFIGEPVRIHSPNYTDFDETVTLIGFDSVVANRMLVDPPLSSAPPADYIVNMPDYDESTDIYKLLHPSMNPSAAVVSGVNSISFDVSAGDVGLFYQDAIVVLRKTDYSSFSNETTVLSVVGNTITVRDDLGFTPDNTYTVDLIGFVSDEEIPYRFI